MKTLAIRLDDELHAQLSVLAQLQGSTITDEIRQAIEARLESLRTNPMLEQRAQAVLDDIERDAQGRKAAIATLFGSSKASEQPATRPERAKRNPRQSDNKPATAD